MHATEEAMNNQVESILCSVYLYNIWSLIGAYTRPRPKRVRAHTQKKPYIIPLTFTDALFSCKNPT